MLYDQFVLEGYEKVVVTGGLGFIGRHVVRGLLALGLDVTVVDNALTASESALPVGATLVLADIRDADQTTKALAGADLVFHLAANSNGTFSVTNPRFDFETNVTGTFNVFEAAACGGARRLVYMSSASVYGVPQRFPMDEDHPTQPFIPYGASKLAGEVISRSLFHSSGLPVVAGRPFCVYGPGENPRIALVEVSRYLRWHLNHRPIQVVGDADRKTRDFVHVSDVVAALLLIADLAPAGEVFNIGSGQEVSMRELATTIGTATGRPAVIEELPQVTQDTYRLVAGISKLRALGYVPRTSLDAGVRELAAQLGEAPELPGVTTIFAQGQHAEH